MSIAKVTLSPENNSFCTFRNKTFFKGLKKLCILGAVVLGTFYIIWFPFLKNFATGLQVLKRIFPVARGVFEGKVSNIWCLVNLFLKVK